MTGVAVSISSLLMIGIGLSLLYSILAILMSATQEMITGWLSVRASSLDARLRNMLADNASEPNLVWGGLKRLSVILCRGTPPALSASTLYKDLHATGLITSASAGVNPSYISNAAFSQALAEALRVKGALSTAPQLIQQIEAGINALPSGRSTSALKSMLGQANGDIEAFKTALSAWFDEGMDRLNGIYTRWSRSFSLVVGLLIALFLNIDSIDIAATLLTLDGKQQQALIAVAQSEAVKNATTPAAAIDLLPQLNVPMGRHDCAATPMPADCGSWAWVFPKGWSSVFGWLVTAIAISFGSHFWFELLGKFLDLRTSGPKAATADTT